MNNDTVPFALTTNTPWAVDGQSTHTLISGDYCAEVDFVSDREGRWLAEWEVREKWHGLRAKGACDDVDEAKAMTVAVIAILEGAE